MSRVTPDNYDAVKRAFDIMNQNEIPVVMINGKAKANPTADEVVSEYRDGHGAESATLASQPQN